MDNALDVQRALGRIEGKQSQILDELQNLRSDFSAHKADDLENFSKVRGLVFQQRDVGAAQVKLLSDQRERVKGAGAVILAMLGALATFVGSAVIAVLSGAIKLHR